MKRKIQSEKDSENVHEIAIKGKKDIANKIKMNFKNLKLKINREFHNLKNYSTYYEYFQSKIKKAEPSFANYKRLIKNL